MSGETKLRFPKVARQDRGRLLLAVSLFFPLLILPLALDTRSKDTKTLHQKSAKNSLSADSKQGKTNQNLTDQSTPLPAMQKLQLVSIQTSGGKAQISETAHPAEKFSKSERPTSPLSEMTGESASEQDLPAPDPAIEAKRQSLLERQLIGWAAAKSPQMADMVDTYLGQGREYNLSSEETGMLILQSLSESIDRDDYAELLSLVRSVAQTDVNSKGPISVADDSLIEKDVAYNSRVLNLSPEQAEVFRRLSLEARDRLEAEIGRPQGTAIPAGEEATLHTALTHVQQIFRDELMEHLNPEQIQTFLAMQQQ